MISRRTLFARLTAVAAAPLAKWLPKPCDKGFDPNVTQLLSHDGWVAGSNFTVVRRLPASQWAEEMRHYYKDSEIERVLRDLDLSVTVTSLPVPQEEA